MDIIIIGASDIFDLVQMVHGPAGGRVIGYCGLEPITTSRYADFPHLDSDIAAVAAAHPGAAFVPALSSNARRRALTGEILAAGAPLLSTVHPQATIFPSARLGRGVVVQPQGIVSTLARVEDGVYLNYGVLVGHDVRVGAFSFIAPGVRLLGEVEIGEEVFIGTNAVILPRVRIGDGARIAAGAVVHKSIPAGATVMCEQKIRVLGGGA